ncbi:MAG: hypothetical protein AAGA28_11640 [Pseudomonadota bacterium]
MKPKLFKTFHLLPSARLASRSTKRTSKLGKGFHIGVDPDKGQMTAKGGQTLKISLKVEDQKDPPGWAELGWSGGTALLEGLPHFVLRLHASADRDHCLTPALRLIDDAGFRDVFAHKPIELSTRKAPAETTLDLSPGQIAACRAINLQLFLHPETVTLSLDSLTLTALA